jgi:hypothetical protein
MVVETIELPRKPQCDAKYWMVAPALIKVALLNDNSKRQTNK